LLKTNVWITAIAIILAMLVKAWMEKQDRIRMLCFAGLLAGYIGCFDPQPPYQYISNRSGIWLAYLG